MCRKCLFTLFLVLVPIARATAQDYAIFDASGVRIRRAPIRRKRVLAALGGAITGAKV